MSPHIAPVYYNEISSPYLKKSWLPILITKGLLLDAQVLAPARLKYRLFPIPLATSPFSTRLAASRLPAVGVMLSMEFL